jgi:hypothetical protein
MMDRGLSPPQQQLLQHLLASRVCTDSALKKIWVQVEHNAASQREKYVQSGLIHASATSQEFLGRDLNDTLSIINRSLKPTFGLEIRSVSMALHQPRAANDDDEDSDEEDRAQETPQLYHAIVNCQADRVSKLAANPDMTKNPHELALFRLILERLVEMSTEQNEEEEDHPNDGSARKRRKRSRMGAGCQAALSDLAMINMRTELTGAHANKLTIEQVQNMLDLFLSQGWFVVAANSDSAGLSQLNRDGTPASKSRKKKKTRYLQLGPRSYLEFAEFLRKLGLEQEALPQFLVHA